MWENWYIFPKLPPPPHPYTLYHCVSSAFVWMSSDKFSYSHYLIQYHFVKEYSLSLSLCVFHVVVSFPLHPLKIVLLFKIPIFPQLKIVLFCNKSQTKKGHLMFKLPTLIFPSELCPMLIFFSFCFSLHSNCSEIWGLSSPNTIEQWDTSGLYNYPDQTRWLFTTIVRCHTQLWCGRLVPVFRWRWQTAILSYSWPYYCLFLFHLLSNQIPGWSPAGLPT